MHRSVRVSACRAERGSVSPGRRGTLQLINAIAPAERRAEVVASFMIACFLGNSLPVIGIAVLSQVAGSTTANVVFACLIAALGALAFVVEGRTSGAAPRR